MSGLVFRKNHQVHVNLTAEEEALILSARPGQTLDMPFGPIQHYREKFEAKTQDSLSNRIATFGMHSMLLGGTLYVSKNLLLHSSYISALATTVASIALIAAVGHAEHRSHLQTIGWAVKDNDFIIRHFAQAIKNDAQRASQINFVRDIDRKVSQGEKLTLAELGQLVNVNTAHFREASEALAITVLSAKAVIAMQDKKIKDYTVANSSDRSFMNGANSDLILLKLWDQYAKQIDVTPLTENASTGVDIDTSEAVSKSPRTLSSTFAQVAKFYKLGLQRAWESILGNHPKATDHLTQVESSFTVPEIETTANIEERLRRYGLEILDLPALEPIAYK